MAERKNAMSKPLYATEYRKRLNFWVEMLEKTYVKSDKKSNERLMEIEHFILYRISLLTYEAEQTYGCCRRAHNMNEMAKWLNKAC